MPQTKTIVITGGAGFIGSHLAERLLRDEDNRVLIFDSFRHKQHSNLDGIKEHPRLEILDGDVRNPGQIRELITKNTDQIYHLSSIVGIQHYCDDPLEVIDVNVIGTRHVVEAAMKHDVRMLFTSTSEVFGRNPNVPWDEDDDRVVGSTSVDRWSYSTSKALCEHMIFGLTKHKGLRCSIVRFFNVYGPRQNPIFVVSKGIHRALNGQAPLMYDSGLQNRCFTYVQDAVEGMMRAANYDAAIGEAFNIGNNQPTTIRRINELILELCGQQGRLTIEPVDTGKLYGKSYEDIQHRVPKVEKAKKQLDWSATIPVEEGLSRCIAWARANPWWLST